VRGWTARRNCAIITWWKNSAHNAEPQWPASRKPGAGARNYQKSPCRRTTRGACAEAVSWPELKRCKTLPKQRKP